MIHYLDLKRRGNQSVWRPLPKQSVLREDTGVLLSKHPWLLGGAEVERITLASDMRDANFPGR